MHKYYRYANIHTSTCANSHGMYTHHHARTRTHAGIPTYMHVEGSCTRVYVYAAHMCVYTY